MASGDTLLTWHALDNEPPTTLFATPDTRNAHPVLIFNQTTAWFALFRGIMPRHYGGSGVTLYIHYAMSVVIAGNIDWDGDFERIGDQQQNVDSDGFAGVQSVDTTTVPGTTGLVDIVNIPFTNGAQMDSIAVGESFRLRVSRDAPNDTATGDAELYSLELKET